MGHARLDIVHVQSRAPELHILDVAVFRHYDVEFEGVLYGYECHGALLAALRELVHHATRKLFVRPQGCTPAPRDTEGVPQAQREPRRQEVSGNVAPTAPPATIAHLTFSLR